MRTNILTIYAVVFMAVIAGNLFAQHYVPTEPLNKNIIYEEFTGVRCPNCPAGHTLMAQILANNPGRAFVVAYHPYNSSYTLPYAGDPDFRRHYPDSLYMMPYCGTSRYMPSAFVNRRLWVPGERLTDRVNWVAYGNTIKAQPSPLNVGMATRYDTVTKILTVVADVYFTSAVAGTCNLVVTLAENNLVSQQSGATGPYTHKHTFRESFVGQWGDLLSTNAQPGTFQTRRFTFNNTITQYNMENCELMAFVINNASKEVITGIGCAVGDTTFHTPDVTLSLDTLLFTDIQQCIDGLTATIRNNTSVPLDLAEVQQQSSGYGPIYWLVYPWPFTTFPYTLNPGDSVNINVLVGIPTDHPKTIFLHDSLLIVSEVDSLYLKITVDRDLIASTHEHQGNPGQVAAFSSYPNPFQTSTTLEYFIPESSQVTLEVLNISGQVINVLENSMMIAGNHAVTWNGDNRGGQRVPGGIYFYRLTTDDQVITHRGVVIR
jgi:hypothetical protein